MNVWWQKKIKEYLLLFLILNRQKELNILSSFVIILLCDGRMVSASDSQPQDRAFESRQKPVGSSKPSHVGYGWRQWCLGSLSHKWVPGYRQRWQLYLDYPWRLEACERVYTPRGVEQVMDVTGLPGIIICKALWASFSQEKRYIRTAYHYYYYSNYKQLPWHQVQYNSFWSSLPGFWRGRSAQGQRYPSTAFPHTGDGGASSCPDPATETSRIVIKYIFNTFFQAV